ncbi:Pantothenate kinase family protein [Zea mays]|uniref:Pantothenate kinase family protein n=1 Tax=Zea mays TaxID=4577 RepID=A0A1D6NSP1_MAIZE|nr:Pantothenate kinase family protein [Zea mays]
MAEATGHGGRVVDLSGAEIRGDLEDRNPPIFLPRQPAASPLLALDIGGTLIKLVYTASRGGGADGTDLRFAKFERRRLQECFNFIRAEGLLASNAGGEGVTLKATGGGAYKFADDFLEKLGVCLDKLDEMDSVVSGANFLLQSIPGAAFTHMNGLRNPVDVSPNNLFPYLLVNIGSGVSILKVTGNRKFERVTGTHIGGGTMFGLAKLLTGCKSYDEFLQLSQKGDNFVLDLIVKDICGELVCQKQGLSTSTLASSFGKVITSKKKLTDYKPEDLASTLLSAFTYNIAQIAFLVASLLGLRRVFFGGSYIRGHKSTMENISYAIDFWSQSQMQAVFLRHEGYLGALGALMSYGDPSGLTHLEVVGWSLGRWLDFVQEPHHESAPVDGTSADEESDSNIFPYLLVNIGSGVSMIEVLHYEEFLELSQRGNNLSVDLTVGDIYGEEGYPKIAYFVANLSGLKRIFFRGAYVCGHEKTMDKISRSLKYWSKGEVQTTFLCHEGFLGTLGAFWSYENMGIDSLAAHEVIREVLLGAPYTGQFPSLPVTQQQENGEHGTLEGEVESLRHDNALLKAEVERLQKENALLRAKLVRSGETSTL